MNTNFNPMSSGSGPTGPMPSGSPLKPIIAIVIFVAIAGGIYYFQSKGIQSVQNFVKENITDMTGQNSSISEKVDRAIKEATGGTVTSQSNPDTTLNEKLNAYVGLLNTVSDNVLNSYDRYGQWVNFETGPTGQERNVYGLYQLNDYDTYLADAEAAFALTPKIPLDDYFPKYKEAYLKLKPLIEEAYSYYDQEDYKDDNFAKGKAMHADLMAAFKAFEDIHYQLSADYEVVDIAQRKKEIEQYKAEGRNLAYSSANALATAQELYIYMRDELAKNNNNAASLNADTLKAKVDQFETILDELKANKSKTAEIKSEYGITGESLYDGFVDDAEGFLKSAKSLYRNVRDKSMPERDVFSESTDGTPENLIYTYNQMVDAFNFMNRF